MPVTNHQVTFVVESFFVELPSTVEADAHVLRIIGQLEGVHVATKAGKHRITVVPAFWIDLNDLAQCIVEAVAGKNDDFRRCRAEFSAGGNLGEGYVIQPRTSNRPASA